MKRGCQKPRIDVYIPGDTSRAEQFIEFLAAYGKKLYPWQEMVFKRWNTEDEDGKLTNQTCGLSVPRQNGKTELISDQIIVDLIFNNVSGLYTAQKQNTVDEVRNRVLDFFYNGPEEVFNLLTDRFRNKPKNFSFIELELPSGTKSR